MRDADFSALVDDTKQAEGLKLKAYKDAVGVWTIGFGTNLQELEIDVSLAERWLVERLATSARECERFPWFAALTARRQRAIVELVYNLGLTRFLGFTRMQKALSGRDYDTAALELLDSKWAKQVGPKRSQRLAEMIRHG